METKIIVFRIFIALVLGGLIGWQREHFNKPAGVRTHILVCLGSALVMMNGIHMQGIFPQADPSRIASQVISGIGFLGAGTIMKEGNTVVGLTTASSIWLVGTIGVTVGSGFYVGAVIVTVLGTIVLSKPNPNK